MILTIVHKKLQTELATSYNSERLIHNSERTTIMRYISLILLFSIIIFSAEGQVTYSTINGHVVVVGVRDSTKIIAESHKMTILFNYEAAEMKAKLDLNTFDTGIDSLNNFLLSGPEKVVTFNGKMGIKKIFTQSHPQQSFDIVGNLTLNAITIPIIFKATLTHLSNSNSIACMLTASSTIKLSDFSLHKVLPGFLESVDIQIVQAVLRRATE